MDVCLGRDAATVQAGATDLILLDDNDLQALVSGIFCGAVASRPRADNQHIT